MKTSEQTFVIAGYAGAGKTTIAKAIAESIGDVMFCAYTGKAANVLREKGCTPVGTIHSLLYSVSAADRKRINALEEQLEEALQLRNKDLISNISKRLDELRKPKFSVNKETDLAHVKLVIVDEFSMLTEKIIKDLHKMCKKVLFLGDPFQLPPVDGKEVKLQTNIFLTEIHRQALESPIIRAATDVREGRRLNFCVGDEFTFATKKSIAPEIYMQADQIIVGRNNTRTSWNNRFRQRLGFADHTFPQKGEKIICLKNNHALGLFNGMIETVVAPSESSAGFFNLHICEESPELFYQVWTGDILPTGEKYDFQNPFHAALERFDFAYAITCHKSQGSEFNNLVVYNEPIGKDEERRRWQYTAITRAKQKLTLVQPS